MFTMEHNPVVECDDVPLRGRGSGACSPFQGGGLSQSRSAKSIKARQKLCFVLVPYCAAWWFGNIWNICNFSICMYLSLSLYIYIYIGMVYGIV